MVLCALLARPLFARHNGEVLSDFDVLSLVDTAAQWYADATEREQLQLENKLRELLRSGCMRQGHKTKILSERSFLVEGQGPCMTRQCKC